MIVDAGVGRVGLDGFLDGDHGPGGLVAVAVSPGGDCGVQGRAQRAGLDFAGQMNGLLQNVGMNLKPEGRPRPPAMKIRSAKRPCVAEPVWHVAQVD